MQTQPLLLTIITFLPLLSVLALLLLRSDDHVWIRRIALAASLDSSLNHGFHIQAFERMVSDIARSMG